MAFSWLEPVEQLKLQGLNKWFYNSFVPYMATQMRYHFGLTKRKDPTYIYSIREVDLEPPDERKEQFQKDMERYKIKTNPKYANYDKNNPPPMPKL